jgi:hypothetical protein
VNKALNPHKNYSINSLLSQNTLYIGRSYFEEGEGMIPRQAKIILIEFIGYFCNFSQKELKGWDKVFARLKLKHC